MFRTTIFVAMIWTFATTTVNANEDDKQSSFNEFLVGLKTEALQRGVNSDIVERSFSQIKPFKKALVPSGESDSTETLETYLPKVVPEDKVVIARALFKANIEQLERIAEKYEVQPRFIVALWGTQSHFGETIGSYPVITVMASLAFENQADPQYREEFFASLKILQQDGLTFEELTSTGKGTMGQVQFSPSWFLAYAQDGDGDGKKDIWGSQLDAFASVANFLKLSGWKEAETWGRQVKLPNQFDLSVAGLSTKKSFNQWQSLGVRRYDGKDLPNRDDILSSLVVPDGEGGRHYLVYDNYRALMKWMASDYEALTVTYLSERIKYPPIE